MDERTFSTQSSVLGWKPLVLERGSETCLKVCVQDAAATGLTNPLSRNMSYGNYSQPAAQGRIRTQIVLGTINTG